MLPNKLVDQLFLELGIEKDDLDTATLELDMEHDKEYTSMLEDFNQKMELASKGADKVDYLGDSILSQD